MRWEKEEQYVLSDQWVADRLAENPHFLEDVDLGQLRPDLFPQDRVLAEMIIARDRLRGIEHPEMDGKLTAHE